MFWGCFFALLWFGFVYSLNSDEPVRHPVELKNISLFSLSLLAEINQSTYQRVIIVSEGQAIATTNQSLCLLELQNGTTELSVEENLQTLPSEIHAVYFEGTISAALNYPDRLDVYQFSSDSPGDGARLRRVIGVQYNSLNYPSSSNVVVSARTRNLNLYIKAVYLFENSWITTYNPLTNRYDGYFDIPRDCSCTGNCLLQPSYNNRQGQVIVQCSNDKQYLCNLYEEECFRLPQSIKNVVTSRINRKLAVAIKHSPDLDQDQLLIISFDDDDLDTTFLTLASSKASIRHPGRIRDLAVVPMNGSDQEVVCFLDSNSIFCFVLRGVDNLPVIEAVTLPANVNVNRFQGATDSSLAVEATFSDTGTFLMRVDITITELGNCGVQLDSTVAICPTESITLEPTVTTKYVEITTTVFTAPSVTLTQAPSDNSCQGNNGVPDKEKHIIIALIGVVSVILLIN